MPEWGHFSVGTGEALCVHPLPVLPGDFSSHARVGQEEALAPQPKRGGKRGDRLGNRGGSVA